MESVLVVFFSDVPKLVSVTEEPVTTLPAPSVTVPTKDPFTSCAVRVGDIANPSQRAVIRRAPHRSRQWGRGRAISCIAHEACLLPHTMPSLKLFVKN